MNELIYLERDLVGHPRADHIIARHPKSTVIECESYSELFNRKQQNFRAQKSRPALIIARKSAPLVYPVPGTQHLGAPHNYYFSHLLNCPFDCRYCFLQGMFRSANFVLFVNYEEFADAIRRTCAAHRDPVHVFSGYDCDSLALEPMTDFAQYFVPLFADMTNATLELRTKSVQVRSLLQIPAHEHCVVAMSLAPSRVIETFEHGTPNLEERLRALRRVQDHGWPIGLRFDPLVAIKHAERVYSDFFDRVFDYLDPSRIHSVTLGALRFPRDFAKQMFKLYPEEPLFSGSFDNVDGTLVIRGSSSLLSNAARMIKRHIDPAKLYPQHSPD